MVFWVLNFFYKTKTRLRHRLHSLRNRILPSPFEPMIQHFLLIHISPLGPAQIILERFMGPSWKQSVSASSSTHHCDDVSDLVEEAVNPMYEEDMNLQSSAALRTPTGIDTLALERQEQWRQLILKLTVPRWQDVMMGRSHVLAVQDKYVVLVGRNDLIFMITGTGDDDEMGLHTILTVLLAVVQETCGKIDGEKVTRNFGKMCLILDAMFDENQGSCLSLEQSHIMHQSKLKKPQLQ